MSWAPTIIAWIIKYVLGPGAMIGLLGFIIWYLFRIIIISYKDFSLTVRVISAIIIPALVFSYLLTREKTIFSFVASVPEEICVLIGLIFGYLLLVILKLSSGKDIGLVIASNIMSMILCAISFMYVSGLNRSYDITMGIVLGILIHVIFNGIPVSIILPEREIENNRSQNNEKDRIYRNITRER
jgi:hypothetical protein